MKLAIVLVCLAIAIGAVVAEDPAPQPQPAEVPAIPAASPDKGNGKPDDQGGDGKDHHGPKGGKREEQQPAQDGVIGDQAPHTGPRKPKGPGRHGGRKGPKPSNGGDAAVQQPAKDEPEPNGDAGDIQVQPVSGASARKHPHGRRPGNRRPAGAGQDQPAKANAAGKHGGRFGKHRGTPPPGGFHRRRTTLGPEAAPAAPPEAPPAVPAVATAAK